MLADTVLADTVALVVAAGRGTRFGGQLPKQYAALRGRPVLRWTLEALTAHPRIDAVRCVIHPDDRASYDAAAQGLDLLEPVAGADSRQGSVRNGLESLEELNPGRVLIHDGARPFVTAATIDAVIDALGEAPGAIAAVPVTDTLKRESGGAIVATVERAALWRAQTPQGFRYREIMGAHRQASALETGFTDDAAVAEHAGHAVVLVEDSLENLKVTSPEDLIRADRRLGQENRETRIGNGFDVHRFGPGDHVILCGLKIPHSHGLVGHSDADVGLHSLTDAILGAAALGDIGQHFPPSDTRWAGADSGVFLRHAKDLIAERGGRILNVDLTLICEGPKIGPHREAMAARVAELLELAVSRVSVKATTTETLGFTGRREGIAAQATAALSVPAPRGS